MSRTEVVNRRPGETPAEKCGHLKVKFDFQACGKIPRFDPHNSATDVLEKQSALSNSMRNFGVRPQLSRQRRRKGNKRKPICSRVEADTLVSNIFLRVAPFLAVYIRMLFFSFGAYAHAVPNPTPPPPSAGERLECRSLGEEGIRGGTSGPGKAEHGEERDEGRSDWQPGGGRVECQDR